MNSSPSTNGSNGRAAGGRFSLGNAGGPGNPHGKRTAELRAAMLEAVTDEDLRAIVAKLVEFAKRGSLAHMKELFDRLFGNVPMGITVAADDGQKVVVVEDENWYGNDAHARAAALAGIAARLGVNLESKTSPETIQNPRQKKRATG